MPGKPTKLIEDDGSMWYTNQKQTETNKGKIFKYWKKVIERRREKSKELLGWFGVYDKRGNIWVGLTSYIFKNPQCTYSKIFSRRLIENYHIGWDIQIQ